VRIIQVEFSDVIADKLLAVLLRLGLARVNIGRRGAVVCVGRWNVRVSKLLVIVQV